MFSVETILRECKYKGSSAKPAYIIHRDTKDAEKKKKMGAHGGKWTKWNVKKTVEYIRADGVATLKWGGEVQRRE